DLAGAVGTEDAALPRAPVARELVPPPSSLHARLFRLFIPLRLAGAELRLDHDREGSRPDRAADDHIGLAEPGGARPEVDARDRQLGVSERGRVVDRAAPAQEVLERALPVGEETERERGEEILAERRLPARERLEHRRTLSSAPGEVQGA